MWKALGRWMSKWLIKSGIAEAAVEAIVRDKLDKKPEQPQDKESK